MTTPSELELDLCDRDIREVFKSPPRIDGSISGDAYFLGTPILFQLSRDLKNLYVEVRELRYEIEELRKQNAAKS